MTAVNAGVHEVGVRLPLQSYSAGHAVFMYSTAADGNVTLQLRESDDLDRSCLAAMLERLQEDSTFSVSYQDGDMLSDGSIDVLLSGGTGTLQGSGATEGVTATFDLFDSSSGPDLTLSPQTFTNSAEAFINDNSNSLGVSTETEAVATSGDDRKSQSVESPSDPSKTGLKRPRPKAASPNRQGPQQCQVCAKVFGNASALAKHKLTHSDERKYACTMCGKAFKRQDHLNGHMLTHRNKKPYECKAEGCGKSYCDARSLRRHTENHHSTNSVNVSTTTLSPAQGAASGDAASPHGSSCIQYAPPQTPTSTSGKSQLQQLLSTEPVKNGNGGNDGLTKQQLDLIHQIMEQTQRQSQTTASKPSTRATKHKTKVQKNWSSTTSQQNTTSKNRSTSSQSSKVATPAASPILPMPKVECKPVECNLCHRKFKNIPALNGHMRLHGGYFKKEPEIKKTEKKEVYGGSQLQTASVSVRALIEEKINNKRSPQTPVSTDEATPATAPPLFPLNAHSSTSTNDIEPKTTSFVVPAPPQQQLEKLRRHSDADAFTAHNTQQEADALADLILKKDKTVIKRTVSDPGNAPNRVLRLETGESLTLTGVTYQSEDSRDFFSPNLRHLQETMLLESVQTQHMTSIQFQGNHLLQNQGGNQLQQLASLEEYANVSATLQESVKSPTFQTRHTVNQDLQAVLNSPLPEGLAEFSTFHSPGYQTHSPAQYAESPHSSVPAQSPLQSPLVRHDSPGFAYPTPPASHEAQSPCFGQHTMLPMVSPNQNDYTNLEDAPQPSSPLTAAFFTSTMSSSAAVEEALEEILPGETISNDDIYSLTNSPPPQSPIPVILTPEPSPVAVVSIEPAPQCTFTTSSNIITFPVSTNYLFQSQMLPNSDDPLLSSSPKDTKKKFEFNGLPLKVITNNGVLDLQNSNFTGILVDSNGELKLIQTNGNALQTKNIIVTGTSFIHAHGGKDAKNGVHKISPVLHCTIPSNPSITNKQEVFVSPSKANPARTTRKRPRSEPLRLPVLHQSRLRATRSKPHASSTYTPPPLLNPTRTGSGLYCSIPNTRDELLNSIPESDSTPHINIGPSYQCRQLLNSDNPFELSDSFKEDLVWSPFGHSNTDSEVEMYLDFACCAAVPGGGRNKEYALHLLHMCGGNIPEAMLRLMHPSPALPADHPLLNYHYSDCDRWSPEEISSFQQALFKYDKDFFKIAREVETKSTKECVQFYYVWKKVCMEEYKGLKATRDVRRAYSKHLEIDTGNTLHPDAKLLGLAETESPLVPQENRSFICEYTECGAIFSSKAALNGHIRIHGGHARNSHMMATSVVIERRTVTSVCHTESTEDYPCKICGKVFTKIKSRSAHMKSHRPPDVDPNKKKEKDIPRSPSFEVFVSSPFNT